MKKIITIGSATQDVFILYEEVETLRLQSKKGSRSFLLLEAGVKTDVQKLHYSTGGGGTNSATALKRLGIHALPCFKIGAGKVGEFVTEKLKAEGLDLSLVIISPKADTAISFIIPTFEKNYTALTYRGANTQLTLEDVPFAQLHNSEFLYITAVTGATAQLLPKIVSQAKQYTKKIAANPGTHQIESHSDELYQALKYIDILILNAHESKLLLQTILKRKKIKPSPRKSNADAPSLLQYFMDYGQDTFTLYDYFLELLQDGPSLVVVTNGAEGVYVATSETVYFQPSIPTTPITAVGAGDAFGSTFVGTLALGVALEECILYGVINASSVISRIDAKTGLLTLPELEARAKKIGLKQLRKFAL